MAPLRRVRHGGRLLLVLVGTVLTLVVGTGPAAAHDVLLGTTPAGGSRVGATPGAVVLTFDQPAVAMGTQILVTGPSGQVQDGPPRLVDSTVTQALTGGAPAGDYTVAWRVTSADGHPVTGTFTFTSTSPGSGTVPSVAPAVPAPVEPAGLPTGAVVLLVALVLVAVAVAVVLLRRRRTGDPAGS
ncbi:copper resistance protein CopC [Microlunatus spumicola]|uniref:copper resistance protein CopC n=1 Tax=Microlunatus spumicola TaxID=81499 RepID=UPI0019572C66